MKTVVEELKNYFEQQLRIQREGYIEYTGEEAFFDAFEICKNALEKEKQQIINAYMAGEEGFPNDAIVSDECQKYYSETFNNND